MASNHPVLNESDTEQNLLLVYPAVLADPENNKVLADLEHGGSSANLENSGDLDESRYNLQLSDSVHKELTDPQHNVAISDPEHDFNILADDSVYKTLPGAHIFRVSFAMHTAMPHLVIRMKNNVREVWRSLDELIGHDNGKCLIMLYHIVGAVIDSLQLGSLDDMIVSFHIGSWSNSKHKTTLDDSFHAHLVMCENKQKYMEIFNNFKTRPPMNSWWPNKTFVSRLWRIKNMSNIDANHEANVYNNPIMNWRIQDLKDINENLHIHESATNFQDPDSKVVFHTYKPQIGLLWTAESSPEIPNQQAVLAEYTKLLYKLASDIIDTKTEGCQICVSPTRTGFPLFDKMDDSPVYGYLQVSGLTFYKYCPLEKRESWLQNYKQWNGRIYT